MQDIHDTCAEAGQGKAGIDYARGAHIAGFRKVAQAMYAAGVG